MAIPFMGCSVPLWAAETPIQNDRSKVPENICFASMINFVFQVLNINTHSPLFSHLFLRLLVQINQYCVYWQASVQGLSGQSQNPWTIRMRVSYVLPEASGGPLYDAGWAFGLIQRMLFLRYVSMLLSYCSCANL